MAAPVPVVRLEPVGQPIPTSQPANAQPLVELSATPAGAAVEFSAALASHGVGDLTVHGKTFKVSFLRFKEDGSNESVPFVQTELTAMLDKMKTLLERLSKEDIEKMDAFRFDFSPEKDGHKFKSFRWKQRDQQGYVDRSLTSAWFGRDDDEIRALTQAFNKAQADLLARQAAPAPRPALERGEQKEEKKEEERAERKDPPVDGQDPNAHRLGLLD